MIDTRVVNHSNCIDEAIALMQQLTGREQAARSKRESLDRMGTIDVPMQRALNDAITKLWDRQEKLNSRVVSINAALADVRIARERLTDVAAKVLPAVNSIRANEHREGFNATMLELREAAVDEIEAISNLTVFVQAEWDKLLNEETREPA